MTVTSEAGRPLAEGLGAGRLYRDWLRSVRTPDEPSSLSEPAPWFVSPEARAWEADLLDDAPAADRVTLGADLRALGDGRAGVVVTGQQPGFLGGPLLTLFKVATTVALARRFRTAGRPTVPVFWSGDDDDDLREALDPVAWQPPGDALVASEGRAGAGNEARRRLGPLPGARWQETATEWLETRTGGDDLGLGEVWRETVAAGGTWADLQRRLLLRAFSGHGLLVVSGDDGRLHRAAEPLYRRLLAHRRELADLARDRGRDLAASGQHAQISQRSLARNLYLTEGDHRIPLAAGEGLDAATVRPGVLFRSPVQDWLLRPRAVVAGPGEVAYLQQLEPLYGALDIPRSPLVPRLSAWLLPPGLDRTLLARHGQLGDGRRAAALDGVAGWLSAAGGELAEVLGREAGLSEARAAALAAARVRRWSRGLEAMVRGEVARRTAGERPDRPRWVFPGGARQERRLSWVCALVLWGSPLLEAVLAAADAHLELGAAGTWHEWELTVPPPAEGREA